MSNTTLEKRIFDSICKIQGWSGRTMPRKFNKDICPVKDVVGFDSLNGAEATAILSGELECDIGENPFVSGYRALSIRQIAEKIEKTIERKTN